MGGEGGGVAVVKRIYFSFKYEGTGFGFCVRRVKGQFLLT
jgi:hypothetical protein